MRKALLLLTAVALLTACGSPQPAVESDGHTHTNVGGGNVDLTDFLPDAGLAALSRASALVVHGHVTAVTPGIQVGGPEAGYTIVTVAVDETLKGNAGTRTVDVALLTQFHGSAVVLDGRPTPKVGDRGVWMLRPIAPQFGRKGYVLTNQNSQILARDGGLTGGGASSAAAREVKQLGDLASVVRHLRAAAGSAS